MEYLLKVSAVIVVFYGIYRLFLQRDTFFEANRWFLILGILMSFTIPLIVIPIYHEYTTEVVSNVEFSEVPVLTENNIEKPFDIMDYLPMVYALGITIFSLRFFFRLISLASVIKKNKSHKKRGYIFTETTTELSPFSFFNWIVYNPNQFNSTELEQIITHEKVHAKQYHSIDILLMEICCVFLWFHPFVWLYNKSLKQNLEFLADKYALNQFNDTKSYQYTLLKASVPNHQMALSNHFYNSLIKKRIAMLQKSKSKKINLLKYVLVVPALALFLMSFNTEDVYVEKTQKEGVFEIFIQKNTSNIALENYKDLFDNKFDLELSFKNIQRNNEGVIKKITVEILITEDTRFSTTQKYREGEAAIRDFIVKYDPINKTIDAGDAEQVKQKEVLYYSVNSSEIKLEKIPFSKGVIYFVDNKQISKKDFEKLNPSEIYSISVLKDKHATDKYGEKGKDGVIEITMKKENDSTTQVSKSYPDIKVVSYGNGVKTEFLGIKQHTIELDAKDLNSIKNPLYIIDGEEVSDEAFKKINSDDIYSMTVLKDKHATDKYGEKAKDGVVEITMKKENEFIMVLRKKTSDDQLKEYRKIYKEKFKSDLVFEVVRNSNNEITFYDIHYSFDGKRTLTDKSRDDKTPINPILIKYDANTKSLSTKSL